MKCGADTMILYLDHNLTSPFGFAAYVALAEKRVKFEVRPVLLHDHEQQSSWYSKLSSTTEKIPTLSVGAFSISESLAIIEYVEETCTGPDVPRILPRSPEQRARARQVLSFLRTEIGALRVERHAKHLFFPADRSAADPKPLSAAALRDAGRLVRLAQTLGASGARSMLGAKAEDWSIADAELAFALRRLLSFPIDRQHLPDELVTYAHTQWERPTLAAFQNLRRGERFVEYH